MESKSKQSSQTMTLNKDLFYKFVHHSVASAAPSFGPNSEPGRSPPPQENPCRAWQFYTGGRAQSEPYVETVDSPVCPSSPHSTGFQSECTEDGEDDATWQQSEKPRPTKRRGFGSKKRGKTGCALGKRGVPSQTVGVTSASTAAAGLDISPEAQAASEEELTSSEAEDAAGIRGPKASGRERFLRVLFWKFRELQMLLGSDLLLFGNDQHKAVSLHLMEVGTFWGLCLRARLRFKRRAEKPNLPLIVTSKYQKAKEEAALHPLDLAWQVGGKPSFLTSSLGRCTLTSRCFFFLVFSSEGGCWVHLGKGLLS